MDYDQDNSPNLDYIEYNRTKNRRVQKQIVVNQLQGLDLDAIEINQVELFDEPNTERVARSIQVNEEEKTLYVKTNSNALRLPRSTPNKISQHTRNSTVSPAVKKIYLGQDQMISQFQTSGDLRKTKKKVIDIQEQIFGSPDSKALSNYNPNINVGIKQTVANLEEMRQIREVTKQFEKNNCAARNKINDFDIITTEAEVMNQCLLMCYKIVQGIMFEENPNFDQQKMEFKLEQIESKMTSVIQEYQVFKGKFFATNEPVLNKDMLSFKIERIQKNLQKQEDLISILPNHENQINDVQENIATLKQEYKGFERNIFEKKNTQTKNVVKESVSLIQNIQERQSKVSQDIVNAKEDLDLVVPHNNEQREVLKKIYEKIEKINERVDKCSQDLEVNLREKDTLDYKHKQCEEIESKHGEDNLVEMIGQSRKLSFLVRNHDDHIDLNRRLKQILNENLQNCEFDLQKILLETKKYLIIIRNNRKDDYDDIIKYIQRQAQIIGQEIEGQESRLQLFEQKVFSIEGSKSNITEGDFVYIKKEVSRFRSTLLAIKGNTEQTLDDSTKLNWDSLRERDEDKQDMTLENLQQLKMNQKTLSKIQSIEIQRLKKNIDGLEGFSLRSLKSRINEDNKRSQLQISKMKKNYENLQRAIESLNVKIYEARMAVDSFNEVYTNEDLERENEVKSRLESTLDQCDHDTNGTKSGQSGLTPDDKTLQAQKKRISGQTNRLVNLFNENNRLIKESNKVQKSEKELNELIRKNFEIQEECSKIDDLINYARLFVNEINGRLDQILGPILPDMKAKYAEKNQAIDECDQIFDKNTEQIADLEKIIERHLTKVQEIKVSIDRFNPVNNPTPKANESSQLVSQMQTKLDLLNTLQDFLESSQSESGDTRDHLINLVQPLNEMEDREVPKSEIFEILKQLGVNIQFLLVLEGQILPKGKELEEIEREIAMLLEHDKNGQIEEAEDKLKILNEKIDILAASRQTTSKRLDHYRGLVQQPKHNQGKKDPDLAAKLKGHDSDIHLFENDLGELDPNTTELKRKRNEATDLLSQMKMNHQKFSYQQIYIMIQALDEQIEKSDVYNQQFQGIDLEIIEKIRLLQELLSCSSQRKQYYDQINVIIIEITSDLESFREALEKLPGEIENLIQILIEMQQDSETDPTADYWDQREQINQNLRDFKHMQTKVDKINGTFARKKQEIDQFTANLKKVQDIEGLKALLLQVRDSQSDIQDKSNEFYDLRDETDRIRQSMGECEIPVNIALRANEMEILTERLDRINDDFKDLEQADNDHKGDSRSEHEIKKMIQTIVQMIKKFDSERAELQKFQTYTLEKYKQRDFLSTRVVLIIIEIREHKFNIASVLQRLAEVENLLKELDTKLIEQDMENALKLMEKRLKKLRERLQKANDELEKVAESGRQMDGNTTHNEEDDLIDELKLEMPDIFKDIESVFITIDNLDVLLQEVISTRSIEKLSQLKKDGDKASASVEQLESLAIKLENRIIEWNALWKLCARDDELEQIDELSQEFKQDLIIEKSQVDKLLSKNKNKTEKEGDPKGKLTEQKNGILSYIGEIEDLEQQINELREEKSVCFKEFDADLPKPVKLERLTRLNDDPSSPRYKRAQREMNVESDKPIDKYYMIFVNCKYKKRIHVMLKRLRLINGMRRELDIKYGYLKKDVGSMGGNVKTQQGYKPVKGDLVDEMFAAAHTKQNCQVQVKRVEAGKYMFGTKKILAKIINGKLVIRVGGGYQSVDEFIETYAKQELLKMQRMGTLSLDPNRQSEGMPAHSSGKALGMGDMKAQIRASIGNIQTYGADGGFNQKDCYFKQSSSPKAKLTDLTEKFDAVGFGRRSSKSPPSKGSLGYSDRGPEVKKHKVGLKRNSSNGSLASGGKRRHK